MNRVLSFFLPILLGNIFTNASLTPEMVAELPDTMHLVNRAFEGFAVEDFVPSTYLCIYNGYVMVREGNYTHLAMAAARANDTISEELYPEQWKNLTLNVTALISEEMGDFWFYCATTGIEWYDEV